MWAEPDFDLAYTVVGREPLIVLMSSDHPLAAQDSVHPRQLVVGYSQSNDSPVLKIFLSRLAEVIGLVAAPASDFEK